MPVLSGTLCTVEVTCLDPAPTEPEVALIGYPRSLCSSCHGSAESPEVSDTSER